GDRSGRDSAAPDARLTPDRKPNEGEAAVTAPHVLESRRGARSCKRRTRPGPRGAGDKEIVLPRLEWSIRLAGPRGPGNSRVPARHMERSWTPLMDAHARPARCMKHGVRAAGARVRR